MQSFLRSFLFLTLFTTTFAAQSQSWTRITGLPIKSYYSLETLGTMMYAGTTDSMFFSKDKGTTWTMRKLPTTGYRVQAFTSFYGRLFVGTGDGVYKTSDTGKTWAASNIHVGINQFAQWKGDLYAATQGGGVFQCSRVSNTWSPFNTNLPVATDGNIARIIQAGKSMIAFGTFNGSVFKYQDSLQKWMPSVLQSGAGPATQVFDVAMDGTTIYVQLVDHLDPIVLRSEDTGATWSGDVSDLKYGSGGAMLRGYYNTYLFWNDTGGTWKQERMNASAISTSWGSNDEKLSYGPVTAAREFDRRIIIATGTGVWAKQNGSPALSVMGNQQQPEVLIYPNPAFKGMAQIRAQGLTDVRVADLMGRIVFENTSVKNGEQSIQINAPGIYIVSMLVDGQMVSRRLQVP